jgi:hypothetical protein
LLNKQFINSNIKSDNVLAALFENFMKSIEMDDTEVLEFLKFQQGNYTKFHGDFFNSLRTLLKNNPDNKDFKIILRNFLRSYDCFVSVKETNGSITSALHNIEKHLPEMLKKHFVEMTDKIIYDNEKGLDLNLSLLKNEIIPFIGRYISKMNDFGPVRDYVSLLIHNVVRLETGSKDVFSNDLNNLLEYIEYNFDVDNKYIKDLKMSLINTYEATSNIKNNSIQSFFKLLESGTKESENLVSKGVMEDMTESLLFGQNVHFPLMHLFLPLSYKSMFMFSELWIEKEYEEFTDKKRNQNYTEAYKVFITFDIQSVGYFEAILALKESKLSLEIYVPNSISNNTEKVKNDLMDLLSKNNLEISNLNISESIKKRKFNEIFSNLTERKSGVDVTI